MKKLLPLMLITTGCTKQFIKVGNCYANYRYYIVAKVTEKKEKGVLFDYISREPTVDLDANVFSLLKGYVDYTSIEEEHGLFYRQVDCILFDKSLEKVKK